MKWKRNKNETKRNGFEKMVKRRQWNKCTSLWDIVVFERLIKYFLNISLRFPCKFLKKLARGTVPFPSLICDGNPQIFIFSLLNEKRTHTHDTDYDSFICLKICQNDRFCSLCITKIKTNFFQYFPCRFVVIKRNAVLQRWAQDERVFEESQIKQKRQWSAASCGRLQLPQ